MRIALFGGAFNPIHLGHLCLAEFSHEKYHLDYIIFIPCGSKPPHKSSRILLPAKYRLHMVRLAIKNNPYFRVDTYEIDRENTTYTYHTIEYFKKKYSRDELFFLIGSDTLLEIPTWAKGWKILDYCKFIVGIRAGVDIEVLPKEILKKVILFKMPLVDITSSDIRSRVRKNMSIRYLVPDKVKEYIRKHKFYAK